MSSSSNKPQPYYKNEITDEDIQKLEEIFSKIFSDKNSGPFQEPVDYEGLQLYDYPSIIKHPMDLGTCKDKLLKGEYKIFQEFMDDLNLIWENCRHYNQPNSQIVKQANSLDKKMKTLIDKQFKHKNNKNNNNKSDNNSKSDNNNNNNNKSQSQLSLEDKSKLIDIIKQQNNDGLTQIVKIILKACPEGIEDIDNDKLQIKIDFLTYKEFNLIVEYVEKTNAENNSQNKNGKK